MITILETLQQWYAKNCDGHWEHNESIKIKTIDNPGWRLQINLMCTELENKIFKSIEIERSEEDWLHCFIENRTFQAACGPKNLIEMLQVFVNWLGESDHKNSEILSWLENWYMANCNGDWEHLNNFSITTIDQPGWKIKINVEDTLNLAEELLENKPFTSIKIDRSNDDWIHCFVQHKKFQANCGIKNLVEALQTFIDWAGHHNEIPLKS